MPAEDRIRVHNSTWKQRGFMPIKLMLGTQLVAKFARMAASFWPQMPEESRSLFSLYLADGKGSLDRDMFAKLFASIAENKDKPKTEAVRRLSAANLFASYALSPFYGTGNHWEIIQGWTIAAAHISWAAHEAGLEPKRWQPTFRLAVDEALAAMTLLVDEIISSNALRPQTGFELDELTRSRNTICAGILAINGLVERERHRSWQHAIEAKKLIEQLITDARLLLWGESAVPFFLAVIWGLDTMRADQFSDVVLIRILFALVNRNSSPVALKLSSPYESADEANAKLLRRIFDGETAMDYEATDSFAIEPLVTLATRRLWRNALASVWAQITKVQSIQLIPDAPHDLLLWRWGHLRRRQ